MRPLVIRFGAMGDMVLLTGLLQALHRRFGLPCDLLCGAPREQPLLREITDGSGSARVHALGEQLPIPRLLALLSHAHSLISIDSGPAHAGAALGYPSVVLFGATVVENWLPRGAPTTPVIGLEAPPSQPRRVDEISVSRVVEAWRSVAFERNRA